MGTQAMKRLVGEVRAAMGLVKKACANCRWTGVMHKVQNHECECHHPDWMAGISDVNGCSEFNGYQEWEYDTRTDRPPDADRDGA
jgi:hypothetical protein